MQHSDSSASSPGILSTPGSSKTSSGKKLTFAEPIAEVEDEEGWHVHLDNLEYGVDHTRQHQVDSMPDSEIRVATRMRDLNTPALEAVHEVNISVGRVLLATNTDI